MTVRLLTPEEVIQARQSAHSQSSVNEEWILLMEKCPPGQGVMLEDPISKEKYDSYRNSLYKNFARLSWYKKGMISVIATKPDEKGQRTFMLYRKLPSELPSNGNGDEVEEKVTETEAE